MNIEDILIHSDKVGKRQEVLNTITQYQRDTHFRGEIPDLPTLFDQAYKEVISGK